MHPLWLGLGRLECFLNEGSGDEAPTFRKAKPDDNPFNGMTFNKWVSCSSLLLILSMLRPGIGGVRANMPTNNPH